MIPDITFNINNNITFNSSPNLIIGNLRNLIDDDNSNISIINNIHNHSIELSSSNDLINSLLSSNSGTSGISFNINIQNNINF